MTRDFRKKVIFNKVFPKHVGSLKQSIEKGEKGSTFLGKQDVEMCIWNDQIRVPTYLNFNYIYPIYYLHKTYISDVSSLFGMKFESAMSLLKFNFPQSYLPFVELHCHLGNKFIHELISNQFVVRIPGGLWHGFNHVVEYTVAAHLRAALN